MPGERGVPAAAAMSPVNRRRLLISFASLPQKLCAEQFLMNQHMTLELTRACAVAQPVVCDTVAVGVIPTHGFQCGAEFFRTHVDPVAAQGAQHPPVSGTQLRPLGVDLTLLAMRSVRCETRMRISKKVEWQSIPTPYWWTLTVVLSVSPIVGGRQQFSCRCCGCDMAHWNPPRRKTPHEASMGLERYGVLREW
jgi:hypothetical protein